VKLTYASEEDKYTPSKLDKYYQVRASSKFGISRSGKVLAPRARRVSRYVLYLHTHTHVLRSLRPLHRVSQLQEL
jgi:hypothetical protein